MEPYYQDDSCVIYCADCRDVLPELVEERIWYEDELPRFITDEQYDEWFKSSFVDVVRMGKWKLPKVDLVLTDPPYGMEFQSNYRRVRHEKIHGDDNLPLDIIHECINISSCACYVFCRWDNLPDMPKPKSVLAWIKNNWSMGDLKHEHGRQWEACCFYPGPLHSFRKRIPDVIQRKRTGNVLHPTEKPLYLMTALIDANEGDLILDLFMGSGTTLRAAKDLGRKAIGIEIEEKYCEIAAKRLAQEVLPL